MDHASSRAQPWGPSWFLGERGLEPGPRIPWRLLPASHPHLTPGFMGHLRGVLPGSTSPASRRSCSKSPHTHTGLGQMAGGGGQDGLSAPAVSRGLRVRAFWSPGGVKFKGLNTCGGAMKMPTGLAGLLGKARRGTLLGQPAGSFARTSFGAHEHHFCGAFIGG